MRIARNDVCGLSLVVPCYNEQDRLPSMLDSHIKYIKKKQTEKKLPDRVEIILIDDGSKDATLAFIQKMTK